MNTTPLGVRLNNPGNVDRTTIKWQGMSPIQSDPRFISFVSPSWGFRCMTRIIREYFSEGNNTITKIVDRWAPPEENNDNAYVSDVSQRMSVNADAILDFDTQIMNLLKAITWHEQGMMPYEDNVISLGITLEKSS